MTGQRFGRLTVICKDSTPRMWKCLCDCGKESCVTGSNLRSGSVRSCGCLAQEWAKQMGSNKEFIAKRSENKVAHGHRRRGRTSVEYRTWLDMKARCYREGHKSYAGWGGRGIRVCDRWLHSFDNFLADMGPRPADKDSIDRIDPNGDYAPENCRWATMAEQGGEHRRTVVPVTYKGKEYPSLAALCRSLGLKYTTIHLRIQAGHTVESAIAGGASRMKSRRTKESYWRKSLRTKVKEAA